MNIQLSKSITAYQADDRIKGTEVWVLTDNRVELAEVPATSVLCDALDQLALYAEFFRLTMDMDKMNGASDESGYAEYLNMPKRISCNAAIKDVVKQISLLNEGKQFKSEWSNKL